MASQGPNYGGTMSSAAFGATEVAEAWVNPGNAAADDGTEATITAATFDTNDVSEVLWASNFGFTVPAGATIDGLVVEIDRRCSTGGAVDFRVQFYDTSIGAVQGDNKASVSAWPTTLSVATYGGATDTWGIAGIDSTFVNQTDFGLFLSAQATGNNTDVQVDFMRVTVHYTAAGGGAVADTSYHARLTQGYSHL